MIVIAGAGLTGLCIARQLKGSAYTVYEREDRPGGLCRSVELDGFTFDYTGHLLHLRDPSVRRMVRRITPGGLDSIVRRAAVYCMGKYLPYPFQANTCGLPPEVVYECVMGFIEAAAQKKAPGRSSGHFRQWVTATFGKGIARHFFIPYNEKLWQADLSSLTSEWADWSIPRPTVEEVVRGALGIKNEAMGYNATFLYPRRCGIETLARALAGGLKNMHTGAEISAVNLAQKRITLQDGTRTGYDRLVSTLPLPRLLAMIEDLPPAYAAAAAKLRYVSVQNLNIAVNRERVSDFHWVYFPEPEFPFYRVGFYSNISPSLAPPKTSSLYIEISACPNRKKSPEAVRDASLEGLRRCGILKRGDRIIVSKHLDIDCAYVVFDTFRRKTLAGLMRYLSRRGVLSTGRYGAWTYSSMEDALRQGRQAGVMLR